ncbi:MAG: ABC transporter substrate-binding protein [Chloroflexi bacterium]|nr:ABC transporter substrate-binding protein [Chloroflexota bacterium]
MREPRRLMAAANRHERDRGANLKSLVTAGLIVALAFLVACAAPATPTATPAPKAAAPKPAATSAPAATAAALKAATPAAATPAAAAPKTLRTVTFASTTSAVGLVTEVIKKKGIDAKYGINLDVKNFDPSAAEKAVALKQAEVGIYAPVSAALANDQDVPITFIAPLLYNHIFVIVGKDTPYKTLADLKGKKIGTLNKISGTYTSAQVFSRESGWDFEKDHQLIEGPLPALGAFMEKGDVDAITINDPIATNLILTGKFRQLMSYNDEWKKLTGQPMFMIGLAAHRPWIDQNKDVAALLNKMVLEGTNYIIKNPGVFDENKDFLGVKDAAAIKMIQERMPSIYPDRWDASFVKNAQHIIDRAVELKILPSAPKQDMFIIP